MKHSVLFIISLFLFFSGVFAQPTYDFDLKKPQKFENRTLAAEKTGEKKFSAPRRFIQNGVTHYNYYFNANNRLNEIIARCKASFRDDYTQLLPFYNYDLNTTSGYKTDLDSVIYKATAGILLHDLRNSFIDNLYLLIGESYYFRNDLDSAHITFQYVNYAFSPKEKDGWDKVIGSNSNEGGNVFSVSTKENRNIINKALSQPPSRNESFIWQIRTYLAKDELTKSAGLIQTLKNDPLFPERLNPDLQEMQALWFYKQNVYDSAAFYLEKALGNAESKQELARWEYLIAQLYERSGNHPVAKTFYNRATRHTLDPFLEVYSILNALRQDGAGNEKEIKAAVETLEKMARKDKYVDYRDIIYYTAADIEAEHNNPEGARQELLRSIKYSVNNPGQKSRSYLKLGDLFFAQNQYVFAKQSYDSVNINSLDSTQISAFTQRKLALDKIARQSLIVERQDSLQRIAAMPEHEREVFLKNLARQLRRQKGIKDDNTMGSGLAANNKTPDDLFGSSSKNEWYFSNGNLKTKGFAEFRSKWGNRPNSDNWRRSAAIAQQFAVNTASTTGGDSAKSALSHKAADISYEGLLATIPLTPDQKKLSSDSLENALFALGKACQNGLEAYPSAINAYERLLDSFPSSLHTEETLYNLYYCYGKIGRTADQQRARQALTARFPGGSFNATITNPGAVSADSILKRNATAQYTDIYNLFIEGKFADAVEQKKIADEKFGKKYWTPQLLYIEAVYDIQQRNDSTAKTVLTDIIKLYPSNPLAEKSKRIIEVLARRRDIEAYLTNLQIKRPGEDDSTATVQATPAVKDSVTLLPVTAKDTVSLKTPAVARISGINKENKKQPINIKKPVIGKDHNVAMAAVNDSLLEAQTTPKDIPAVVAGTSPQPVKPGIVMSQKIPQVDTSQYLKRPVTSSSTYTARPEQPHYVAFVMNKVDPVYVTEARNAFNRYNKENYYNTPIESVSLSLTDDIKMVLFNFENAAAALDYMYKAKGLAAKEIIPWLMADKYSFIIISSDNLELLKNRKDYDAYRRFLSEAYPGKGF